jgi:hypothetical protein
VLSNLTLDLCQVLLIPGIERLVEIMQVVFNDVLLQLEKQIGGLSYAVNKPVGDSGMVKHGFVTRKPPVYFLQDNSSCIINVLKKESTSEL